MLKNRWYFYFSLSLLCFGLVSCHVEKKSVEKSKNRISASSPYPLSLQPLSGALSDDIIYSKNVDVKKLEAFDIDRRGNIYYARLGLVNGKIQGENKANKVYIYKAAPNEQPKEYMTLKYFGHPYNITVEEEGKKVYLWISSNGSKHNTGKYWDEPSVSRIQYIPGKIYEEGYGGTSYFLNTDLVKTQVAVNRAGNFLCIAAESKKGNNWSFYTYSLKEAEALPDTTFSFTVTLGGEDQGEEERTFEKKVVGRDLSRLTPIGNFTLPGDRSNKPEGLNSYWLQGFNIDKEGFIYMVEGEGNRQGRKAHAFSTVLDVKGEIVRSRTRVIATTHLNDLDRAGVIHRDGNLEPEGMAVKEGVIYLGFQAAQVGRDKDQRRAHIFKYKSNRR